MVRRAPWEDTGLDPRFRNLSKQTYPLKVDVAKLLCALPSEPRRMGRLRFEEGLVEKYGNQSQKFGLKFGLYPSWAAADFKCKNGGVEMDY